MYQLPFSFQPISGLQLLPIYSHIYCMKGHLNIPSPPIVPEGYTDCVPDYNLQVAKVLGAFIVFIAAYVFTFLLAIGICVGLGLAGFMLIASSKGIFLILLGALFLVVAVLMLIFSLRFFVNIKTQDPDLRELRPEEAPELFELIKETANTVKAPVPRKVYVSMEMNASVWIPNGLLNPILKPHKYLTLGLPLVASLNKSELKAILAHELAHFSQNTTWLTSYLSVATMSVQKVLYKDDGMAGAMDTLYKLYIFRSANSITLFFTRILHDILIKAYELLNYTYQGLSRSMEYHADITSASVAGTYNTIHALRRNELAQVNYDRLIGHIGTIHDEQKKQCKNLVWFHQVCYKHIGISNRLPIDPTSNLPLLNDEDYGRILTSRVRYSDLWSSHPSLHERETFLRAHPLPQDAGTNNNLAIALFTDIETLSEELTADFYKNARKNFKEQAKEGQTIIEDHEVELLENEAYGELLNVELAKQNLAPHYGNYYFMRDILSFDVEEELRSAQPPIGDFDLDKLYNAEVDLLSEKFRYANEAYQVVMAIFNRQIKTNYFELDGVSYKVNEAGTQSSKLEKEVEGYTKDLKKHDTYIFLSFYKLANKTSPEAGERFKQLQRALFIAEEYTNMIFIQYINAQGMLMSVGPNSTEQQIDDLNSWLNAAEKHTREILDKLAQLKDDPCAAYVPEIKTIRETILAKPLESLSVLEYNPENSIAYYHQLEEMYGNTINLYRACYKSLIKEMDELILNNISKPLAAETESH